ncbi:MAG TPA: glycosyltransferase family 1 protein [Candidatus Dormibacteraeota bacterium]|nr:glycosyltransferase family 1 protein [Candidatus Dormibacteraeota bacterium]
MRLAIDARLAAWKERTGTARYTSNLLRALAEVDKANTYSLILTRSRHGMRQFSFPNAPNFESRWLPWEDRLHSALWLAASWPYIESLLGSVDVLHLTNVSYVASRQAALVITVHDVTFISSPENYSRKDRWFHRTALNKALQLDPLVIADSEYTANSLHCEVGVDTKRIRAIHLAPDPIFAPDATSEDMTISRKYKLETPFFLFVSTIEPRKNLSRLLTAFLTARRRGLIWQRLIVTGRIGWLADPTLRELRRAQTTGEVELVGFVDDSVLACFMRQADALVYPSLEEGFGLPVLEAMTSGTPVVTSNAGALPEVAGEAAMLVDPLDPYDICRALVLLGTDPKRREDLRGLGLQRARSFTWRKTAEQTLAVYEEATVAGRGRRHGQ